MINPTQRQINRSIKRFVSDTRGNLAIAAGGSLMAIMMMTGSAIDYGRAHSVKSAMMMALDSAALAGANELVRNGGSKAAVEKVVQESFDANIIGVTVNGVKRKSLKIIQNRETGAVEVHVSMSMPTTITQLAGIKVLDIGAVSAAQVNDKDVELTMMLDVTGSMRGRKIVDMKAAAKELVDTLLPKAPVARNKVRIGLVPYSNAVNAGIYAKAATNGMSTSCASERSGAHAAKDTSFSVVAIEYAPKGCSRSKILPLTDNRDKLNRQIRQFSASGTTAGHMGIAWSWYTLSPNWNNLWPAASRPALYSDKQTLKVAVLMTDGEFNTAYDHDESSTKYAFHNNTRVGRRKSKDRALALCRSMKASGVRVYTVAFKLTSSDSKEIMETCATDGSKFFDAASGKELRQAFRSIAEEVSQLRVSK